MNENYQNPGHRTQDRTERDHKAMLKFQSHSLQELKKDYNISEEITPLRVESARHAVLQSINWFNTGVLALKTFRDKLKYQRDVNAIIDVLENQQSILDASFDSIDQIVNELMARADYWKRSYGEKLKESADYLELAQKAWKQLKEQDSK